MSYVIATPEGLTAAAGSLQNLGSTLRDASAAAAANTTAIAPLAADEVSAGITALFGASAKEFQAAGASAAAFHDEFVRLLGAGAAQYVAAEAANAGQALADAINGPAQTLLGHPLIGAGQGGLAAVAESMSGTQSWSLDTPFGSWPVNQIVNVVTTGSPPTGGQLTETTTVTTPLGNAGLTLGGSVQFGTSPETWQLTGGAITASPALRLLAAGVGPWVTGGAWLFDNVSGFGAALAGGNPLTAAGIVLTSPAGLANAVLFGHETATLSLPVAGFLGGTDTGGGPTADIHIPFGGVFASTGNATIDIPHYIQYDSMGNPTQELLPSQIVFSGAKFGGTVPELLSLVGINL